MPLFPEWFKLENENLVSEFPNLNEMELRMLAAKKYRLLKFSSQSSNTDNNVSRKYVIKNFTWIEYMTVVLHQDFLLILADRDLL